MPFYHRAARREMPTAPKINLDFLAGIATLPLGRTYAELGSWTAKNRQILKR